MGGGLLAVEEQKAEETTKLPALGDRDRTCFVKRPQENATKKVAWAADRTQLYTRQLSGGELGVRPLLMRSVRNTFRLKVKIHDSSDFQIWQQVSDFSPLSPSNCVIQKYSIFPSYPPPSVIAS